MADTLSTLRRSCPRAARFVPPLVAILLAATGAGAVPAPIRATVVWSEADRVYVAADSGALAPAFTVIFAERGKVRASGRVDALLDHRLASVRIVSGSLERVKKLEKLAVLAEAPAPLVITSMRIGLPADARANLVVPCAAVTPHMPEPVHAERFGADAWRFVRPAAATAIWPESVVVRRFRDAADEEIALERGEIDVAVFWPGEPSARLRADPLGREAVLGRRARGVIVAIETSAAADSSRSAARDPAIAALNALLLGGDLEALGAGAPVAPHAAAARDFFVDAALPGHDALLGELRRASVRTAGPKIVSRLSWLDAPAPPGDSLAAEWRRRGITPLFSIRCPIVARAEFQPLVARIGADAFADLTTCSESGR